MGFFSSPFCDFDFGFWPIGSFEIMRSGPPAAGRLGPVNPSPVSGAVWAPPESKMRTGMPRQESPIRSGRRRKRQTHPAKPSGMQKTQMTAKRKASGVSRQKASGRKKRENPRATRGSTKAIPAGGLKLLARVYRIWYTPMVGKKTESPTDVRGLK